MNWKEVRLEDCCVSITDGDHQPPPKSDTGIPFITIANINSFNKIDFTSSMHVPKDYYFNLNGTKRPSKDDILYSVVGSFGIPVFLKEDIPFVFQRHIALLRPNKDIIYPKFLYYKMLSRDFYQQADTVAIGAAQRTIGLASLRKMTIVFPVSYKDQEKIANALSAYDDLIENNQKQIKLLEECAKRLYKEWFVDLRFPGHEQTKIVDGVPEGWRFKNIDSVFVIQYGKNLPTNQIQADGKYPVYGANGVIGYYNYKNCDDYNVLITSRGNGSGEVLRTHDRETFVTNNSFVVTPKNPEYGILFIYELLKMIDFKRICTGSAQPQLTNTAISTLNILMPLDKTITQFSKLVEPFHIKIEDLIKQNRLLEEARDRLLPKLMNGEIEL